MIQNNKIRLYIGFPYFTVLHLKICSKKLLYKRTREVSVGKVYDTMVKESYF